jgi:hypothetical protein
MMLTITIRIQTSCILKENEENEPFGKRKEKKDSGRKKKEDGKSCSECQLLR